MSDYQIEGDAELVVYTPKQLGDYINNGPITTKSRDMFDVIVKDNNNQVAVLEQVSWHVARRRVTHMVTEGVDPADIFGVPCNGGGLAALGAFLYPAQTFLWWSPDPD